MSHGTIQNGTLRREDFFNEVVADMSAYMTKDLGVEKKIKDRLRETGYNDEQIEKVYGRIKEASNVARAHTDRMAREAVAVGLMDPKLLQENYGLPVMYVRGAINKDPHRFEAIMLDLLKGQPPEDELRKLGMIWDKVDADPANGIEAKPARTLKELKEDPALWNQALKEWAGEQEHLQREAANAAWTDAETKLGRTMAEVKAMTQGLGLLDKEKKVKTVAAARTAARLAEAQWHERNLGTSIARVESAEAKVAKIERDYPELFGMRDDLGRQKVEAGNAIDTAIGVAQRAADDAADGQYLTDFLKGERARASASKKAASPALSTGRCRYCSPCLASRNPLVPPSLPRRSSGARGTTAPRP